MGKEPNNLWTGISISDSINMGNQMGREHTLGTIKAFMWGNSKMGWDAEMESGYKDNWQYTKSQSWWKHTRASLLTITKMEKGKKSIKRQGSILKENSQKESE